MAPNPHEYSGDEVEQIDTLDWEKAIALEPMMKFFQFKHLPARLQEASKQFARLAVWLFNEQRTPERTVAFRKLLEAKDAAVRNRLE